jgi:hypothetical protein
MSSFIEGVARTVLLVQKQKQVLVIAFYSCRNYTSRLTAIYSNKCWKGAENAVMHSIMSVLFRKLDPAFSATAGQQCLFADEGQELSQRLLSC